jgi:hypothetical protein
MDNIKKDLFDLFKLDKMSPEKAEETLSRLAKLVFQAVLVRALPLLSEEDLNTYEKMVETEEADVLFNFLGEKVPDFGSLIKEESENLRDDMAQEMTNAGIN